MARVADAGATCTGFPFNFSEDEYVAEQRLRDTSDLLAEVTAGRDLIESWQYLALEYADADDGTYDYVVRQLPVMLTELEKKQRLLQTYRNHPVRPRRPKQDVRFQERIDTARALWPMERYCREVLLLDLEPIGSGKYKAVCPLFGHDEKTASCYVDTTKNLAYCHGCKRGGDVLKIAQYVLNATRFTDALRALEWQGGMR